MKKFIRIGDMVKHKKTGIIRKVYDMYFVLDEGDGRRKYTKTYLTLGIGCESDWSDHPANEWVPITGQSFHGKESGNNG